MKRKLSFLLVLITVFSSSINAQEEKEMTYLFQNKEMKISGFGGPIMGFSSVQNDFAFFMGGGGAVLFNQKFFLGGYGIGLTTPHYVTLQNPKNYFNNQIDYKGKVEFGHGGFWLGYIHQPWKPIHFAVSSKIGWGALHLYDPNYDKSYSTADYNDAVFVVTPQIEVEFNMNTWLKINVGAGYRLVNGVNEYYTMTDGSTKKIFDPKDYSKPELTLNLYFGLFK